MFLLLAPGSLTLSVLQKGTRKNSSWEGEGINALCQLIGQWVTDSLNRGIDSRKEIDLWLLHHFLFSSSICRIKCWLFWIDLLIDVWGEGGFSLPFHHFSSSPPGAGSAEHDEYSFGAGSRAGVLDSAATFAAASRVVVAAVAVPVPRPADKHKHVKLHARCRTTISGYDRNWLSPFSF